MHNSNSIFLDKFEFSTSSFHFSFPLTLKESLYCDIEDSIFSCFLLFNMSRSRDKSILVEADPEPERTLKRKLREAKAQFSVEDLTEIFKEEEHMAAENNNNANNARKVLGDFTAPTPDFYGRSISIPAIGANNFELKPQLVSLMQQNCKFHGLPLEDPHQFLAEFL